MFLYLPAGTMQIATAFEQKTYIDHRQQENMRTKCAAPSIIHIFTFPEWRRDFMRSTSAVTCLILQRPNLHFCIDTII